MIRARVIVADPPWRFRDKLPGNGRGAEKVYKTMSHQEIAIFLERQAGVVGPTDDAALFLWRVASMSEEALRVARVWGFAPKSEIVWVKKTRTGKRWFGMGRYTRAEHEAVIVATRGKFKVACRATRSVFEARAGMHSEKPDAFFKLVETLAGEGPFVEFFGRKARPGWHVFGDELPGGYAPP